MSRKSWKLNAIKMTKNELFHNQIEVWVDKHNETGNLIGFHTFIHPNIWVYDSNPQKKIQGIFLKI
jgi:hypothetical protein